MTMNAIGLKVFQNAYKSANTGTIVVDEISGVPVVFHPCGNELVDITIDGNVYGVSIGLLEFTAPILGRTIKDVSERMKTRKVLGEI